MVLLLRSPRPPPTPPLQQGVNIDAAIQLLVDEENDRQQDIIGIESREQYEEDMERRRKKCVMTHHYDSPLCPPCLVPDGHPPYYLRNPNPNPKKER